MADPPYCIFVGVPRKDVLSSYDVIHLASDKSNYSQMWIGATPYYDFVFNLRNDLLSFTLLYYSLFLLIIKHGNGSCSMPGRNNWSLITKLQRCIRSLKSYLTENIRQRGSNLLQ